MGFAPGALAATFVSTDARTFQPPPEAWIPSDDWTNKAGLVAGSPQSLIGDLIREGATGVAGHVAEPFLQSTVRPQVLFPAYLSGFNLIEAFYLAIPHLSWQTVVIGDPLCAPFSKKTLSRSDLETDFDASTGMPGFFSKRRMDIAARTNKGIPAKVIALTFLAESRLALGDTAAAQKALEQATEAAPTLSAAQLQLGVLYEQSGARDRAIERYRQVLKSDPKNVIALNNLAYGLAVYLKSPAEGKPLAEKAVALAPNNPTILDTLAWTEYLLGNHVEAARLIRTAARGLPGNAEIRLHAAFIYAAIKQLSAAEAELKAALKLDPNLGKREDVRELQGRLAKDKKQLEVSPDSRLQN
jgi:Tfp pilus assembly protein PilF